MWKPSRPAVPKVFLSKDLNWCCPALRILHFPETPLRSIIFIMTLRFLLVNCLFVLCVSGYPEFSPWICQIWCSLNHVNPMCLIFWISSFVVKQGFKPLHEPVMILQLNFDILFLSIKFFYTVVFEIVVAAHHRFMFWTCSATRGFSNSGKGVTVQAMYFPDTGGMKDYYWHAYVMHSFHTVLLWWKPTSGSN